MSKSHQISGFSRFYARSQQPETRKTVISVFSLKTAKTPKFRVSSTEESYLILKVQQIS